MVQFLRTKFIFIISGLALGVFSFIFLESDMKMPFARVSLPERVIEISGPDVAEKVYSLSELKPLNLLEKIDEAVLMLENSPPLKTEQHTSENICFHSGSPARALRKEISFAILDTKTQTVFEKRCWFSREDAQQQDLLSESIEKLRIFFGLKKEPSEDDIISEELALVVNWWNSHNSDIEIKSLNFGDAPGRYIIVANKYPMLNTHLAYPEDKKGKKYSDIVYVPYSNALHRPELIEEGKKFLNESVDKAFSELKALKVQSVASPGRLAVDTVTPAFIKNIFLTEQTDPRLVLTSDDRGLRQSERVLVRLGTNKEKAYRYTYSSAGALGLGQIMPGTYDSIVRLYPEAKLIKNNDIGRVDVVNGIKASILVFDDHFATVLRRAASNRGRITSKSPDEVEEIKAAIYNGGPGKIHTQTATISSAVSETVNYVAKFKKIKSLSLFSD